MYSISLNNKRGRCKVKDHVITLCNRTAASEIVNSNQSLQLISCHKVFPRSVQACKERRLPLCLNVQMVIHFVYTYSCAQGLDMIPIVKPYIYIYTVHHIVYTRMSGNLITNVPALQPQMFLRQRTCHCSSKRILSPAVDYDPHGQSSNCLKLHELVGLATKSNNS